MLVKKVAERDWSAAGYEGAERGVLRVSPAGGRTAIVRLKRGAQGPRHRHGAGEDVLVLSGKVKIDGQVLDVGDYLYAEAGEEHELTALEDSVIYVSTDKPIIVL